MSYQMIEPYLVPIAVLAFIVFRFLYFKKIKMAIPDLIRQGATVIDVRSPGEFKQGSRPGSVNIPLGDLGARCEKLDKDKTVIVCCASGTRSAMAMGILKKHGFRDIVNAGPWTNTLT